MSCPWKEICWKWGRYFVDLESKCFDLDIKSFEREIILLSLIEITLDLDSKFVEREANFVSWILHHLGCCEKSPSDSLLWLHRIHSQVTATRIHQLRWSPFANIFHPSHKNLDVYLLSLSRTDFRWVWLLTAFVDRTQFGCIGQPSPFSHRRSHMFPYKICLT